MRNFFSYILLTSLLFPSVVETFHAFHDSHSHKIHIEDNLSVHDSEFHCQVSLFLIQEDDLDLFFGNPIESFISHYFKSTFKQYNKLFFNTEYSTIPNRGPPNTA